MHTRCSAFKHILDDEIMVSSACLSKDLKFSKVNLVNMNSTPLGLWIQKKIVMAASSITKNFVVSGERQVEMFANAIEESYQESLIKSLNTVSVRYRELKDLDEIKRLTEK